MSVKSLEISKDNIVLNNKKIFKEGDILGLPLGAIIPSAIVLNEAGLHLLDGSVLAIDGVYSQFCEWLIAQYTENFNSIPTCDEDTWQNEVDLYGQCGKFVIDIVAGTIRLPLITEFIASSNGGISLGLSELDSNKSHIHNFSTSTNGEHSHTIYSKRRNKDKTAITYDYGWSGNHFVTSNGESADFTSFTWSNSTGLHSHNGTTAYDGSVSKPKNVRYPYYIVVLTKISHAIDVEINKYINDLNVLRGQVESTELRVNNTLKNSLNYTFDRIVHLNTGISAVQINGLDFENYDYCFEVEVAHSPAISAGVDSIYPTVNGEKYPIDSTRVLSLLVCRGTAVGTLNDFFGFASNDYKTILSNCFSLHIPGTSETRLHRKIEVYNNIGGGSGLNFNDHTRWHDSGNYGNEIVDALISPSESTETPLANGLYFTFNSSLTSAIGGKENYIIITKRRKRIW